MKYGITALLISAILLTGCAAPVTTVTSTAPQTTTASTAPDVTTRIAPVTLTHETANRLAVTTTVTQTVVMRTEG